MSINLTLDYLTFFFSCDKFFSVVFSLFLLCLVSYIANYDSNNENMFHNVYKIINK